jgi:hypothetical protein
MVNYGKLHMVNNGGDTSFLLTNFIKLCPVRRSLFVSNERRQHQHG